MEEPLSGLNGPKPGQEHPAGARRSPAERIAIRDQLERVLASAHFRNSRRYTGLLRFAVQQALEGRLDRLKERVIGVEVFARDADYDTSQDPVVRTSAVEVRKRLVQYYREPGRETELRIDLPPGSYVPEFHAASGAPPVPVPADARRPAARPRVTWRPAVVAVVVLIAALAWHRPWASPSAFDRFWRPVLQAPGPVLFGLSPAVGAEVSAPADSAPVSSSTLAEIQRSAGKPGAAVAGRALSVPIGDVTALVDIASALRARGKAFQTRFTGSLQFDDLKAGPVVFIGPAVRWLNLVTSDWRFTVDRDEAVTVTWISDRDKPGQRLWSMPVSSLVTGPVEAYALLTRVRNETTGQSLVSIAGLSTYATSAAGQFLASDLHMRELARAAPSDWDRKNIQIVIATRQVGASSGPPRLVAAHFW